MTVHSQLQREEKKTGAIQEEIVSIGVCLPACPCMIVLKRISLMGNMKRCRHFSKSSARAESGL